MPKYLIDANLPYKFNLWNNVDFIHVADLNPFWTDTNIWDYAQKNNLVIVTKDADFLHRIMSISSPPKVIYLKIGNLKIQELHKFLNNIWKQIEQEIAENKLVIVTKTSIETYE